MPKATTLSEVIRPSRSIAQLLNPDYIVGDNTDKLMNIGVHRIASALANGYSKQEICHQLRITTVAFDAWAHKLEDEDNSLIQMAIINRLSELRDEVMVKIMKEADVKFNMPTNEKQGRLASMKLAFKGKTVDQLIRIHDMFDRRITNEYKRISVSAKPTGGGTTNNYIMSSGDGAFKLPTQGRVFDATAEQAE